MSMDRRMAIGYLMMSLIVVVILIGAFILSRTLPKPEGFAGVNSIRKTMLLSDIKPEGQDLTSWADLAPAVERSLEFVRSKPGEEVAMSFEGLTVTWGRIERSLMELQLILPRLDAKPSLLAEHFDWLEFGREVLMTGYYAPLIEASAERTGEYRYPLYGLPEDLETLDLGQFHERWQGQKLLYRIQDGKPVPYFGRGDIDYGGALEGRGLEVAWAKDPLDVFFLHIQGSGLLVYPDGTRRYVLYEGKNGLAYQSLGREMVSRGMLKLEDVTMDKIREYLEAHPEQVEELLSTNRAYVFFKLGDDGPYGAMNRLLTPKVSVATDPGLLPLGSVMLVKTQLPEGRDGTRNLTMISLAQDTGGAIKGERLDFYCGLGQEAGNIAGRLKARSRVTLLLRKEE